MAQVVPLIATPNQVEVVPLDDNSVQLTVNQRANGLYIDVFMNGQPIALGVLCENRNRIVRNAYFGFPGDFFFDDSQAAPGAEGADPDYTGLGGRFQLIYIEQSEIEAWANGS